MGFKWFLKASRKKGNLLQEEQNILTMFQDLEEIYHKKRKTEIYQKELLEKEIQLEQFKTLEEKDVEKLVKLMDEHKSIEEKRQLLRGRLIKNNRALLLISEYEGNIPELLKEIRHTENKQRENEIDINYLEEEQDDLIEEREFLLNGYAFLKGFSMLFIMLIAIVTLLMFGLLQVLRETVWIYLSVVSCVLVLFLVGIVYAKDRLEKGLSDNQILQQKAAKYLNKAKVRYFHHTNYLQFQYDKLGIDSSAKLELYYNRFIKNRNNEKEYERLTRNLVSIGQRIDDILKEKNIYVGHLDNIQDWLVNARRASSSNHLVEDKERIQAQLEAFETYEEDIWKELFALRENSEYEPLIVQKMEDYMILTKNRLDKKVEGA